MFPMFLRPDCGCRKNKCPKDPCSCPASVFGVEDVPEHIGHIRLNLDGNTVIYDATNMVYQTQTDTSLTLDAVNRALVFNAERHIDSLVAPEIGSILHLGDLGDVSTKHVATGSMLVYEKNNNCSGGCVGDQDHWKVWNPIDLSSLDQSLAFLTGVDSEGKPVTLGQPSTPSQTYLLGWNGTSQVSYFQPAVATAVPPNAYRLYMDRNTKQIIAVEG